MNPRATDDAALDGFAVAGGEDAFHTTGCPPTITTARERVEGYRAALVDADIRPAPELIRYETFKIDGGSRGAAELLALGDPPDALFISNAPQCVGALKVAGEKGLSVPAEVGIVCFDDEPCAALATPTISTVSQPAHAIGIEAARLLLRRIAGDTSPPHRILLEADLRIRASSSLIAARR